MRSTSIAAVAMAYAYSLALKMLFYHRQGSASLGDVRPGFTQIHDSAGDGHARQRPLVVFGR